MWRIIFLRHKCLLSEDLIGPHFKDIERSPRRRGPYTNRLSRSPPPQLNFERSLHINPSPPQEPAQATFSRIIATWTKIFLKKKVKNRNFQPQRIPIIAQKDCELVEMIQSEVLKKKTFVQSQLLNFVSLPSVVFALPKFLYSLKSFKKKPPKSKQRESRTYKIAPFMHFPHHPQSLSQIDQSRS